MTLLSELRDPWSITLALAAGASVMWFAPWPVALAVVFAILAVRVVAGRALPASDTTAPARRDPLVGIHGRITSSQLRYVELAAQGLMDKEIADRLSVTTRTVGNTLQAVRDNLELKNRVELARWWYDVYLKLKDPAAGDAPDR